MNKQQGITLIGAIFVVVIVSVLGVYLVKITAAQRATVVMNLQSARAYQAANAGIEWGIFQLFNAGSCAASTTLTSTINGFTVNLACDELQLGGYDEAGEIINMYSLTAHSEYGTYGTNGYTQRRIEVIIHGP